MIKKLIDRAKQDSRIYCLPRPFGLIYFLFFIFLLLVAGTYQNNLVFMMAFLLLALGLVTISQTARNLRELEVSQLVVEPGYEHTTSEALVVVKNKSKKVISYQIQVSIEPLKRPSFFNRYSTYQSLNEISPEGLQLLKLPFQLNKNWGSYKIHKVKIATTYPYGLFIVWKVFNLPTLIRIYPSPYGGTLDVKPRHESGEDFSHLKPYEVGDAFSRIDWKRWAKNKDLMTKEYQQSSENRFLFDIKKVRTLATAHQVSDWIHQCEKNKYLYDLIDSDVSETVQYGQGSAHFKKTMNTLVDRWDQAAL